MNMFFRSYEDTYVAASELALTLAQILTSRTASLNANVPADDVEKAAEDDILLGKPSNSTIVCSTAN